MNNVEKRSLQGNMQIICHGLAKLIVALTGAVFLLAALGATTAKAQSSGPQVTQLQYLQWLAQVTGANLGADVANHDYAGWAKSLGLKPDAGWHLGDVLSRDVLAQTLAQMLAVSNGKKVDPVRLLAQQNIDLSSVGDTVTKDQLTGLTDQWSLNSRLVGSLDTQTKNNPQGPDKPTPGKPFETGNPDPYRFRGPTPPQTVVMCNNGQTVQVDPNDVNKRLAQGWTLGPCTGGAVTMCQPDFDHDDTVQVDPKDVAAKLALGWKLGACPPRVTICHKGKTISVDQSAVPAHLAHGDTLGPCHVTTHGHDRDDGHGGH